MSGVCSGGLLAGVSSADLLAGVSSLRRSKQPGD